MHQNGPRNIILTLSLVLAFLIIVASSVGLCVPDMYIRETANWRVQSTGQDIINLFLVIPLLFITSIQAYKGNRKAVLQWAGVLAYLMYTYFIYCFDVHFNQLFIIYCFILGLSVYLFLWFIISKYKDLMPLLFDELLPAGIIGVYLIIIASIFYSLWLLQVLAANIKNSIPKELASTGLFTNPVQVLDLSVFLPAVMITGILMLRRHPLGLLLTPIILLFFVLMSITVASLVVITKLKGLEAEALIAIIMGTMALISWVLLNIYLQSLKKEKLS